jgi:hypothetical protein
MHPDPFELAIGLIAFWCFAAACVFWLTSGPGRDTVSRWEPDNDRRPAEGRPRAPDAKTG